MPNTPPITSLEDSIAPALAHYFASLDLNAEGARHPVDLYATVMTEIERPLLRMVLEITQGNQSKAAVMLGLSRVTLRKKMTEHHLFP